MTKRDVLWRAGAAVLVPLLAVAAVGQGQPPKAGKGQEGQKAPALPPTVTKAWKRAGAGGLDYWIGPGKGVFSSIQFELSPDSLRDGVPGFTISQKDLARFDSAAMPVPETPFGLVSIGDFPPAKVAQLKRFPTLTYLSIHLSDRVVAASGFRDLTALRGLDLTWFKGNDKHFKYEIARLKNLTRLGLYYGEYTDETFAAIGRMEKLETLGLGGHQYTPARMAHIGKLTRLKALTLEGNASIGERDGRRFGISAEAFAAVAALKELDALRLSDIGVGPDHLAVVAGLPNLTDLQLVRETVSDEAAEKLHGAKSLKRLILSGKTMSPTAVAKLKAAIPGLKVE